MTRHDIAVQLLASMVSTGDGLNAIFESAAANKEDPYVFAARASIKFADALQEQFDKEFLEQHNLKVKTIPLKDVFGTQ